MISCHQSKPTILQVKNLKSFAADINAHFFEDCKQRKKLKLFRFFFTEHQVSTANYSTVFQLLKSQFQWKALMKKCFLFLRNFCSVE